MNLLENEATIFFHNLRGKTKKLIQTDARMSPVGFLIQAKMGKIVFFRFFQLIPMHQKFRHYKEARNFVPFHTQIHFTGFKVKSTADSLPR